MTNLRTTILLTLLLGALTIQGQEEILLYKNEVPNSKRANHINENVLDSKGGITRIANVTNPVLYAYFPEKERNTRKAVLIFPGGGYGILAIDHEGHQVAKRFASEGITAFVVKYRLPHDEIMVKKEIAPLQDAQRAIQLVRERAEKWNIDQDGVGIVGFSAGGHLASTLGTHYQQDFIHNPNNIKLRPDFMLLVYPVISMKEELTHKGSQVNLLGNSPTLAQLTLFSNETQVSHDTPPTFLIHAEDDKGVSIKNSLLFKRALEENQVAVELLVYPKGGHGFGLSNPRSDVLWFDSFIDWLDTASILKVN